MLTIDNIYNEVFILKTLLKQKKKNQISTIPL